MCALTAGAPMQSVCSLAGLPGGRWQMSTLSLGHTTLTWPWESPETVGSSSVPVTPSDGSVGVATHSTVPPPGSVITPPWPSPLGYPPAPGSLPWPSPLDQQDRGARDHALI